jgi:hypothetical protein
MRIYIIGHDGITRYHEPPATVIDFRIPAANSDRKARCLHRNSTRPVAVLPAAFQRMSSRFAADSALEEAGFEPSVPRDKRFREGLMSALLDSPPTGRRRKREPMPRLRRGLPRDRWFESSSLRPSSRTSPASLADTGGQHRRRPMADFLESQRRQRAALLVDAVRSQTT